MADSVNFDSRYAGTRERGEQNTAKSITDGHSVSRRKRTDGENGMIITDLLSFNLWNADFFLNVMH